MKNRYLISAITFLFGMSGCNFYMSDFSPGTLGSAGDTDLNCPALDVEQRVDDLLEINPYKIQAVDSANVAWWDDEGYDFLTFRCMNIRKRLYMITIDRENSTESMISIRAYYNRNKKTWIVAKKFTPVENYRAEKAMEYLSNEMSTCL